MRYPQNYVDHFIREEGYRKKSYKDHLGNWTIGIGHYLGPQAKFEGIVWTPEKIIEVLEQDIARAEAGAKEVFPEFHMFNDELKLALIDMVFNMGINSFRGFKNTIRLIHNARFKEAADNAAQSLWAKQVPNRAKRVLDMIRTGHYVGLA